MVILTKEKGQTMKKNIFGKTLILCYLLIFSLLGNSIVLSQDKDSRLSDLEKELKQAAGNIIKSDLKDIHETLSHSKYNITADLKISAIPSNARKEISDIQERIRAMIIATARKIEDSHDIKIKIDEEGIEVSSQNKEQIDRISTATKKTNISLSSYAFAVEYFVNMNKSLIGVAKAEKDKKKKLGIYIKQAIYVYELSEVIISMIDNLSSQGIEELRQIHKEEQYDIISMEEKIKEMDDDSQAKGWLNALDQVQNHWVKVLSVLEKQETKTEEFANHKERFERIRQKAAMQIKVLEKTRVIKEVYMSMEAIHNIVQIQDIPLLRLDKEEILTLIGGGDLEGEGTADKKVPLKLQ